MSDRPEQGENNRYRALSILKLIATAGLLMIIVYISFAPFVETLLKILQEGIKNLKPGTLFAVPLLSVFGLMAFCKVGASVPSEVRSLLRRDTEAETAPELQTVTVIEEIDFQSSTRRTIESISGHQIVSRDDPFDLQDETTSIAQQSMSESDVEDTEDNDSDYSDYESEENNTADVLSPAA